MEAPQTRPAQLSRPAAGRAIHPKPPKATPVWQMFILAAGLPLVLCAVRLDLDMWYDEAYTIETFVSRGVGTIVTDYSAANNHILYSLLLRPFYLLSDSNYVLRLPSLVFSLGTLWCVFALGRHLAGPLAAGMAVLCLGLNQMFLIHTIQVRGYSLSMCLAALLANLALDNPAVVGATPSKIDAEKRWTRWRLACILMLTASFVYVMPTNVLFLPPLVLTALVRSWWRRRSLSIAGMELGVWLAGTLLGALAYLPVREGVLAAAGPRHALSWQAALDLFMRFWDPALRDCPWLPPLLAVGLFCWGARQLRERQWQAALLMLLVCVAALGSVAGCLLLGIRPFERNFLPQLPWAAVLAGLLFSELLLALAGVLPAHRRLPLAAALGSALLIGLLGWRLWTYPERLAEYRRRTPHCQDGYFNFYAANFHPRQAVAYVAELVSRQLRDEDGYLVCHSERDTFSVQHYFRQLGVPPHRMPSGPRRRATVYLIAPETPEYASISALSGIPEHILKRFTAAEDFGYYRVYNAPRSIEMNQ